MSTLPSLFDELICQRIGLTLLHSLWQIVLIAFVVGLILKIGSLLKWVQSANARYLVQCCGLLAMLLAPLVTFSMIRLPATMQPAIALEDRSSPSTNLSLDSRALGFSGFQDERDSESIAPTLSQSSASGLPENQPRFPVATVLDSSSTDQAPPNLWLAGLAWIWIIGVIGMLAHATVQWKRARQLRNLNFAAPEWLLPVFETLTEKLGLGRNVRLRQSIQVGVPTLVGWIKPVILFPPAMLSGLSTRELELILMHELIHIKRHDYLVNVLQTLIESLLFFHPCVWWLSRQIRIQREFAADEQVVQLSQDQFAYARALLQLEQCRAGSEIKTNAALAATDGSLLLRVRKIVDTKTRTAQNSRHWQPGNTRFHLFRWLASRARIPIVLVASLTLLFTSLLAFPSSDSASDDNESNAMPRYSDKSNSPETLHQAAASGDIVSIQRLLDAGADKTLRNELGDTPCCLAIRNLASQEVIELLDFEGNPRRNPELWGAAFAGDLKKVKELIEEGADPNAYDENGSGTLLNFHPEVTRYLLSKGANPDLQRNENILPVLVGIAGFNTECLKTLLDAGADPNVSSHHNGETALHHSVCGDNFEQVKALLDAGANPNRQTLPGKMTYMLWRDARVRGETPLHRAAAYGTPEIIKLLLDAGADPNIRDANGDSPLSWASWHMRDKAIIDLLDNAMSDGTKDSTDDVNKSKTQRYGDHGEGDHREQHSESTSAPSASPRFKDLAKKGDFEKLHELWQSDERFDLGAVFERAVTDFRTVKHNDGHQQILQFCIDKGLDPLARVDWMKQPAICTAAMYGNIELIEYVANGVGLPEDPFVRASVGDVQYLKTFAESKGDDGEKVISELRDENGFNLLHYATASGLGRTNADYKSKLESTCKFLIECGVATNLVVENEIPLTPALMCAWFGGNPDIMQKLIDAGQIKINELHQAVEFAFEPHQRSGEPFEKVANVILKNGFDINSIYPAQKRTLLHGSSNRGSIAAVTWLLKNGADPNKLDDEGRTSLHVAAIRNRHTSVIELLVDHGADTSVVDNAGNTASDLAKAKGRDKVVSFFEDLAQVRSTGFSRKSETIPPEGGTTNISVSAKENSGSTTGVEMKFWDAMQSGDWETAKECLAKDQSLAGKDFDPENRDTDSFPLWQATRQNNLEMVRRLLDAGADPDAKKTPPFPEGVRETGMPLMNALSHGNFEMINMLLDAGADVHAHPNCDVPFETRVYNAALAAGAPKNMVWQGFSDIDADMKAQIKPIAADAPEIIKLFDRVLSLGGHPNHYAIAIAKDYETIEWLLKNHPTAETRDHWGGNVHEAFLYGAAWHGDARTVELCMEVCGERHTTYAAAHCIRNAITSHNRKGMFEDYRRVIELNLDYLKQRDAFYEHDFFYPLHQLAHKFISDFYYGPLGEEPTVEHQLALAQLCLDKGFDVNLKTHDSGETALSLAIADGHKTYAEFLRTNGAEEPDAKKLQETKETAFWNRITREHPGRSKRMLESDPSLALKHYGENGDEADGYPLYHSTKQLEFEVTRALLEAGADPNATPDVEDPAMRGMPLMNAFHEANARKVGNYDLVHLLLDYDPNLNAHGDCSTPFVDCLFNNMWEVRDFDPGESWTYKRESAEEVARLFRMSFASYLDPDSGNKNDGRKSSDDSIRNSDFPELTLLERVIEMGGQPSLFTLVRHEQHDLIADLLKNCPNENGTAMDWPQSTVFHCIMNGATWCGYPKTVSACMETCPELYTSDCAKHAMDRAIRSHNRDGDIDQYFALIESQLRFLKENDSVTETYSEGSSFQPLHLLAEHLIESSHYEFKCERLVIENDLVRLAELFVEFGYDVNSVNLETGKTVLAIAQEKGYAVYVKFLRQQGAQD